MSQGSFDGINGANNNDRNQAIYDLSIKARPEGEWCGEAQDA